METCELFHLIPKEKLKYLFANSSASADLDCTFLGFEDIYKEVQQQVPKDKIIIDLGCAYATQSYYFRDHKGYIGVELFGNNDSVIHTENSKFYFMSIQQFIAEVLPTLNIRMNDTFAVCSYVPDEEARALVADTFPYCRVFYPDCISVLKLPDGNTIKTPLEDLIQSAEFRSAESNNGIASIVKQPER